MAYPFVVVFIFISLGIIFAQFLSYQIPVFLFSLFFVISIFTAGVLGLIVFLISLILFGYTIGYKDLSNIEKKKNVSLLCTVNSIPKNYQEFLKFSCKVENSNYKNIVGREVNIKIRSKEPFKVPIFYRTQLATNGNLYVFNKKLYFKPKEWKIVSQSKIFFKIWELRKDLILRYREKTPQDDLFALGSALIFGEKSFLTDDLRNVYVKSGLIHLLAISGLHVGMLILVLLILLYPLGKKLSYSITAGILTFYPLFTGLQPPVLRASLMGILLLIGKIKNFQVNSLNILFFVGTVIIVISPDMLFSPSFQLSFIAVLGIILGLNMFNVQGNSLLEITLAALWVSIVAMLFTTPVVMYYFGQFAPASIIATPIATIPLYPYIFLSVLNIITGFSIDLLVNIMNKFGAMFLSISVFFSDLGFYLVGFYPKLIYVIAYLGVLIFLFLWNKNVFLRLLLIFLATVSFLFASTYKPENKTEVFKIRDGYIVRLSDNTCLLFQPRYNGFTQIKLNKLNCKERIFVYDPKKSKNVPDDFDGYIPLNQKFKNVKFIKQGRKVLIEVDGKIIDYKKIKKLK